MRCIVPLAFIGLSSIATAQEYLPPAEVVARAINEQPALARADSMKKVARSEARALEIGSYEWNLSGDFAQRTTDLEGDFSEFEVGASKSFRLPGKAKVDREIGALGTLSADIEYADAKHQAARQLMMLWIEWLVANEKVKLARNQEAIFVSDVKALRESVAKGFTANVELDIAQSALAGSRKALIEVETDVALIQTEIETLFPSLTFPNRVLPISAPEKLKDPEHLIALILERDHEIERFELQARIADQQSRRIRMDKYADPELGLRTFSERNGDEIGVGIFVAVPIGGGYRRAELERSVHLSAASRIDAENVRRLKASAAKQAVINAQMKYEAWQFAVQALNSEMQARDRMREGFEIGAVSYRDLQQQEKRLNERREAEISARASSASAQLLIQIDAHELWITER